jgi:hypothetical protein
MEFLDLVGGDIMDVFTDTIGRLSNEMVSERILMD